MSSETSSSLIVQPRPISREAYKPYGTVIGADDSLPFKPANMGTAKRFNFLADVDNLRDDAKLNMCVFRVSPAHLPLQIKLLEKHQFSTQIFLPMDAQASYLAIVCLGGDQPDIDTLAAFIVKGPQGISYYPGIWHYPITSLNDPIDFACLVHENGTAADCDIAEFDRPITISET